tara:strand:- start:176 stop:412 length:237 start_codon:yes stop_codon:yes gene_type:complete
MACEKWWLIAEVFFADRLSRLAQILLLQNTQKLMESVVAKDKEITGDGGKFKAGRLMKRLSRFNLRENGKSNLRLLPG